MNIKKHLLLSISFLLLLPGFMEVAYGDSDPNVMVRYSIDNQCKRFINWQLYSPSRGPSPQLNFIDGGKKTPPTTTIAVLPSEGILFTVWPSENKGDISKINVSESRGFQVTCDYTKSDKCHCTIKKGPF